MFGDPSWSNYDLTFKAMSTEGTQGFVVMFHFQQPGTYYALGLGSYDNKGHDLSFQHGGKWGRHAGMYRNASIQFNRWYDVKVEVRRSEYRCFVDGQELFRHKDDRFQHGSIGFATWNAIARFRDIEVTAPDGGVLFKGSPSLPGS